jgi:hypothetical protein
MAVTTPACLALQSTTKNTHCRASMRSSAVCLAPWLAKIMWAWTTPRKGACHPCSRSGAAASSPLSSPVQSALQRNKEIPKRTPLPGSTESVAATCGDEDPVRYQVRSPQQSAEAMYFNSAGTRRWSIGLLQGVGWLSTARQPPRVITDASTRCPVCVDLLGLVIKIGGKANCGTRGRCQ